MIKTVLDTNIFVSSFFGGNPRKIIDLWANGKLKLCLSRFIVDEYVEVLERLGLQNEQELKDLLNLLGKSENIIFTSKVPTVNIVDQDPDDNKFIECALALNAQYIISGDNHLISLQDYMGIKINTPKEFLDYYQFP